MTLDNHRDKIDQLDSDIVRLLNERAQSAIEIGRIKASENAPFYVPEREKAVFAKLAAANEGPLGNTAIEAIYCEVISAIRALEKPISVAFLGPKDTFSHMAALRVFGYSADYHPLPSFADIFTEVERGRIDYGIVPVESSMGGSVSDTLDRFIHSDLKIINEVLLHISQNIMARCTLDKVTKIYSKDNALLQCRNWIRGNLPKAELVEVSSTAEAARRATEEEGVAAIASRLAADTYNLDLLAERIEDAAHNYTRFLVIGQQMVKPTGDDKTSLMLQIKDKPGALYKLLLPFQENNISLTRIESRPSQKKAWEYVFFIDILGHAEDPEIKEVLGHLGEQVDGLKILGSFPRAEFNG